MSPRLVKYAGRYALQYHVCRVQYNLYSILGFLRPTVIFHLHCVGLSRKTSLVQESSFTCGAASHRGVHSADRGPFSNKNLRRMATEHRYGHTFYAGLSSPGPGADYTLTSCFANAAKKSSRCVRNAHASFSKVSPWNRRKQRVRHSHSPSVTMPCIPLDTYTCDAERWHAACSLLFALVLDLAHEMYA